MNINIHQAAAGVMEPRHKIANETRDEGFSELPAPDYGLACVITTKHVWFDVTSFPVESKEWEYESAQYDKDFPVALV